MLKKSLLYFLKKVLSHFLVFVIPNQPFDMTTNLLDAFKFILEIKSVTVRSKSSNSLYRELESFVFPARALVHILYMCKQKWLHYLK